MRMESDSRRRQKTSQSEDHTNALEIHRPFVRRPLSRELAAAPFAKANRPLMSRSSGREAAAWATGARQTQEASS